MSDLANVSEGATLHIEIRPGRTFTQALWVADDSGVVVALDGWSGKAEVRADNGRLLVPLDVDVSQATSGPTVGLVTMAANVETTSHLTENGDYDLTLLRTVDATLVTKVICCGSVVRVPVETTVP